MCLKALLNYFYVRKLKGVCIVGSLSAKDLPRKVKVSAVRHRLDCKLGLCFLMPLVTFHFKESQGEGGEGPYFLTLVFPNAMLETPFVFRVWIGPEKPPPSSPFCLPDLGSREAGQDGFEEWRAALGWPAGVKTRRGRIRSGREHTRRRG